MTKRRINPEYYKVRDLRVALIGQSKREIDSRACRFIKAQKAATKYAMPRWDALNKWLSLPIGQVPESVRLAAMGRQS